MSFSSLPWKPSYTQSGASTEDFVESIRSSPFGLYALFATTAFTVFVYLFESSLDARQKRSYQQTKFPTQLETTVSKIDAAEGKFNSAPSKTKTDGADEDDATTATKKDKIDKSKPLLGQLKDKFSSSQSYGLDKINFGMISSTYGTFEAVIMLLTGFMPWIWDQSATLGNKYFGWTIAQNEIKISLIFVLLTTIIGTITSLPFELYSTFKIEKKHGFNKQTIGLFVSDKVKSLVLTIVIGCPFIALLLRIIQWGGEYFYLYVWAFMFCFSVIMMTIVPVVIMPLFNKYEPLPDGALKASIEGLAASIHYPLKKLFVMDGSKRSSHSNAFMFGFGSNKRIVLFDTLLEQVEDNEILAILGHELGHWKLGHTLTNFVVTQVYFGAAFYIFSLCYSSQDLYAAFGFDDPNQSHAPTIIALMLFFQTIWAPVDKLLSFVLTVFSRHCEFGADKFSLDLGYSQKLQTGLIKISLENLGAMCPDPYYSMYHYSHPPLVERLSAMMAMDKKSK